MLRQAVLISLGVPGLAMADLMTNPAVQTQFERIATDANTRALQDVVHAAQRESPR